MEETVSFTVKEGNAVWKLGSLLASQMGAWVGLKVFVVNTGWVTSSLPSVSVSMVSMTGSDLLAGCFLTFLVKAARLQGISITRVEDSMDKSGASRFSLFPIRRLTL